MWQKAFSSDSETKANYFLNISEKEKKKKKRAGRSLCNNHMARRVFQTRDGKKSQ